MGQPRPLFCLFSFFSITILQKNRIVGVEGEHADHLTTTTALVHSFCPNTKIFICLLHAAAPGSNLVKTIIVLFEFNWPYSFFIEFRKIMQIEK